MKLISLLGLLFFITPMFAAELPPDAITPNVCRGKRKKVEKCTGEPCTWEITRGVYDTMKTVASHSCNTPPAGVDCSQFRFADECLWNQCTHLMSFANQATSKMGRNSCVAKLPEDF